MVDQYPFEGMNDIYPTTEPEPDWFGFGLKNKEWRSSPVKHVVYSDGQKESVIEVRCDDCGVLSGQIMDKLKGTDAEKPQLSIASVLSYWRAPKREPNGHDPMFQFPDTRPGRFVNGGNEALPESIHNPDPAGQAGFGRFFSRRGAKTGKPEFGGLFGRNRRPRLSR